MDRRQLLKAFGVVGAAGTLPRLAIPPAAARPEALRRYLPRVSDLQARLEAAIAQHKVPGASVALFKDNRLETAAAGVVNRATGVEMTPEAVMHIGSITKTINATVVMQLVDEGVVSLDAPLKRYLPDFRVADRDATEAITVRMLLNHTSGISGELTPEAGHDQERIEDGVSRIAKMDQLHPPGADLSYCNPGTVLAGYLAQRLTGESWYDLVKEKVFKPLEMDHSIVVPEDALLFRASVGHFLTSPASQPSRTSFAFLPLSYAPAGATAMLSAADLVTFARAHMNDGVAPNGRRLLSAASTVAMRTKTASHKGFGYADFGLGSIDFGLGWMLMPGGVITHGGGGPGIVSWLYAHPASKTAVAVLTNAAYGAGVITEMVKPVLGPLGITFPAGEVAEMIRQAADHSVPPASFVGTYENATTAVRVVAQGNGIAMTSRTKFRYYDSSQLAETAPITLRPIKDGHFAMGRSVVSFVNPDRSGKMGHLAMDIRMLKRTA